jgi:hypothetical protein
LDDCGSWLSYAPEGADLSLLASGTAPLVLDHGLYADGLVGVIEEAWIDAEGLHAVARFGSTARCMDAWQLVADGLLQHVSIGCVAAKEREPDGSLLASYWRPYEISLVVMPRNWQAKVTSPPPAKFMEAWRGRVAARAAGTPASWRQWAKRLALDGGSRDLVEAVDVELARLAAEALRGIEV